MDPSADNLAPLVARHFQRGEHLTFIFRCPECWKEVQSNAVHASDFLPEWRIAESRRKEKLLYKLRVEIQQEVRIALGHTEEGADMLRRVADAVKRIDDGSMGFIDEDIRAASVHAFASEQKHFVWHAESGRWLHKDWEFYKKQKG